MRQLDRVRRVTLHTDNDTTVDVVTGRNPLQTKTLATFGVNTKPWDRAHIH